MKRVGSSSNSIHRIVESYRNDLDVYHGDFSRNGTVAVVFTFHGGQH